MSKSDPETNDGEAEGEEEEDYEEEENLELILTPEEKRYLLYVERGDVISVKRMLQEKKKEEISFNECCCDPLGRNALIISIENENMEIIEELLQFGVKPEDALLHAISEEYVEAVDLLLEHEEKQHKNGEPYSWELIDEESASWTPDITPLILAAHKNNYEILKILLDRGATLPMPHDVKCGCDDCMSATERDSLRHSRSRINSYRALSSPSLISLSSKDPILTAFELSWELRRLRKMENEFSREYKELREQVQTYSMSMLDHTRTSRELEVILNYDPDGSPFDDEDSHMTLSRLILSIDYRQKGFVAHPNVQQLLGSVWFDGMPGFRRKTMVGQLVDVAKIGCMFPYYAFMYMMLPNSKHGALLKKPFIKFICNSCSYMFFLCLLAMVSQRVENLVIELFGTEWMRENLRLSEIQARGALPSYVEMLIIVYVIAFVWAEIKSLWMDGLEDYIKDLWNIVDFICNMFYVCWIGLRATAWYTVHRELSQGIEAYQPREKWNAYDPMLLSEGMFGAANIFSFLKLVHIFSVSSHLGPLQISLGRMVFDIIKFFFIYTLVLFAFGCGLNQLLWYYADIDKGLCYSLEDPDERNMENDHSCEVWRRFSNLFETSQSLFWASFGLVDIHNFDLTGIKEYTRFWSLLMFGSYSVINVVVLLNLLIAMMSSSYSIIIERSDVEWKFARSKLWLSYFEGGSTLPPPFNILPTPKMFLSSLGLGKKRVRRSVKLKQSRTRDAEYYKIMRRLVRRYITTEQKKAESSGVTEDDINELKQDVNAFKFQLFDVLKSNGMKTMDQDSQGGLGRKERAKERLLMKGFNIGIVDTGVGEVIGGRRSGASSLANLVMKAARKSTKKNWNAIVTANNPRPDPIGSQRTFTMRRSGTLKSRGGSEGRGSQVFPTARGWKKLAEVQRRGGFRGGKVNSFIIRETRIQRSQERGWGRVAALKKRGLIRESRFDGIEEIPHRETNNIQAPAPVSRDMRTPTPHVTPASPSNGPVPPRSPTPSKQPTPTPSRAPSPSPAPTPSKGPTPSPSPAPTPAPSATSTPTPTTQRPESRPSTPVPSSDAPVSSNLTVADQQTRRGSTASSLNVPSSSSRPHSPSRSPTPTSGNKGGWL